MRFVLSEDLEVGMVVARDIIMGTNRAMLRKGTELSVTIINRLISGGYYGAYIFDAFSEDVEYGDSIDQDLFQKGVEAVANNDIGELVGVAYSIVDEILGNENISLDLYDLRSYDDYTYHHSVNVALYSVVVGKELGLSEEDLAHLCMAAICHDLGKKDIDPEIINKNGRLTDEEFEAVKMHPKFSYDILYERNDVPAVVRQAVLCHHENENGSGYPLGLGGEEIPLMAKIIHGVDVYDALVSKRPYKNPYSPAESFGYLKDGKGILFDEKVVDTMLKVIPAYMPGMDVELSNGERGLVIAHSNNIFRPVVKLYKDASTINLAEDPMFAHIWIVKTGGLEGSDHVGELNESRGNATEAKDVIVIVDDSVMTLMTSKKVLVGDYDVETFSDAIDAINYYTEGGKIDLMIMDIDMPRMSGIEGIRHLKKIGYDKPFIIMTGSRERETVLECKAIGATDYILKPAQPIYLKERVDAALKKYYDE